MKRHGKQKRLHTPILLYLDNLLSMKKVIVDPDKNIDEQQNTMQLTNMTPCIFHLFVWKSIIKRWSVAESFTFFENHVYSHQKNLIFAINFVTFLALKLIQHVMATGSYCAINLVTFLALKLIQHGIAIGSIKYIEAHILP